MDNQLLDFTIVGHLRVTERYVRHQGYTNPMEVRRKMVSHVVKAESEEQAFEIFRKYYEQKSAREQDTLYEIEDFEVFEPLSSASIQPD